MSASRPAASIVHAEDQARADMYALLAALLLQAPSPALLAALSTADALPATQQGNKLEQAWEDLVLAASLVDADTVNAEFDALFISVSTPQVNPYGSQYLAGFLMEKPLAALRDDLHALGIGRAPQSRELEDHLGALCEVMRVLIAGSTMLPARSLAEQRTFFLKHIAPWQVRCLDDMRRAEGASFYVKVAAFAQAFFEIEYEAFEIDDGPDDEDEAFTHTAEDHHAQ